MKKNGFIAIVYSIATLLMSSCGVDLDSKSSPPVTVQGNINVGYLQPCGTIPGKLTYTVYSVDANGVPTAKYKNLDPYRKRYNNGFDQGALQIRDMEVPSAGAWALVAEVETDCSSCVSTWSNCNFPGTGSVFFKGLLTFGFNGQGQATRGTQYEFAPVYDGKICCN